MKRRNAPVALVIGSLLLWSGLFCCRPAAALDWLFTEGASLSALKTSNPALYAGFYEGANGAAAELSQAIGNAVTVRLSLDVAPPDAPYLAAAGPNSGMVSYAALAAALPWLPQNGVSIETGTFAGTMDTSRVQITTTQMLATGVWDTPLRQNQSAGFVSFALANSMDWNPDDGIGVGYFDGRAIFRHEFLHILGFMSETDGVAPGGTGLLTPTLLDLSRFGASHVLSMAPDGKMKYFSLDDGVTPFLQNGRIVTFSAGLAVGGTQGSHWSGEIEGMTENPIYSAGLAAFLTDGDRAALDRMGYDVLPALPTGGTGGNPGAPEPPTVCFVVVLLVALWAMRNRVSQVRRRE